MVTRSTAEAMDLLRSKRAYLISLGRFFAGQIAQKNGKVHSREVRAAMDATGVFSSYNGVGDYWLGAVFNNSPFFEWTGDWCTYKDDQRNIHERTVKVWRLRDGKVVPSRPDLNAQSSPSAKRLESYKLFE